MPNVSISNFTVTPNTVGIGLSAFSLTGANAQSMVNLAGTWNTSGTPTAVLLNITDTASNANSLLVDLRVGGVSRFSVSKSGAIGVSNISLTGFISGATFVATNQLVLDVANQDVVLRRDAANVLAQRNGTVAQTFNLYNTFTDASNYERGIFGWSGNILNIGTQNLGTGLSREVRILQGSNIVIVGSPTSGTAVFGYGNNPLQFYNAFNSVQPLIQFYGGSGVGDILNFNTGSLDFYPATSGAWSIGRTALPFRNLFLRDYIEVSEMTAPAAPAVNQVRIYAEDNGSGKTRLMARFNTGAAQQIAIEP